MSNATEQSSINIEQLEKVLSHMINTNRGLQSKGITPIAMNVIGDAGLGKTSVIEQTGIRHGFKPENIQTLNLSTLEEIGDLIGIPVTEYKMVKVVKTEGQPDKNQVIWVKEAAIESYSQMGFRTTTNSRMGYSIPEWVAGKTGPGILILDDYTRKNK